MNWLGGISYFDEINFIDCQSLTVRCLSVLYVLNFTSQYQQEAI